MTLRVGDLPAGEVGRRLRTGGLRWVTGPIVNCVRSTVPAVVEGICLHYAAHPLAPDDAFADFHLSIEPARGIRRWLRPQVLFRFDDQAPFAPLPGDQGFPMLEWGLNWCISGHYHRFLVIHAAVLERAGRALLLPAPSGSGKSTLAAALSFRGWRLLSDELALIDPKTLAVHPLPRPVSLKNASIELIRALAPQAVFGAPVHETLKGTIAHLRPSADAVARATETARPGWIVLPRLTPGVPAEGLSLPRGQAFMQLVDNAFNYDIHGRTGFSALADFVAASRTLSFHYHALDDATRTLDRLLDFAA